MALLLQGIARRENSAARTRRYRERKRQGQRVVRITVTDKDLEFLQKVKFMANRTRHPADEPDTPPQMPGLGWDGFASPPSSMSSPEPTPPPAPEPTPPPAPMPAPSLETDTMLVEMAVRIDRLETELVAAVDELQHWRGMAVQHVTQLDGQIRLLEQQVSSVGSNQQHHWTTIQQLGARLDALARAQIQINTRASALQLAVQAASGFQRPSEVTDRAEEFYRFLMRDLIPPHSENKPDGNKPDGEEVMGKEAEPEDDLPTTH